MTFLIALFARSKLLGAFAKPLAWATTIIVGGALLWAAFSAWDYFDDKAAVEADRAASNLETAKAVTKADRVATEADAVRQKQRTADSNDTREAIDHAVSENPAPVASGPITRAATDSLRRRQNRNGETAR